MKFSLYQDSVIGARSMNQDRMGYSYTRDALILVLADGMGGHLKGEVAAQIALQAIGALFQMYAKPAISNPISFLDEALRQAHREILRYQVEQRLSESPRTTIVVALVQNGQAWWAHAGDSRLYWVRQGKVLERTRDHSKVEAMFAMGLIDENEQDEHPERNKVFNCLGSPFEPTLEISAGVSLQPGDQLLLCSDGIWGGFRDDDVAATLNAGEVSQSVPELIRKALEKHGKGADNATAIAMQWEPAASADPKATDNIGPGEISTTIPTWAVTDETLKGEVTDDDIEQAVLEIQKAIERTSS
jgi:PPM family protein phosphatase